MILYIIIEKNKFALYFSIYKNQSQIKDSSLKENYKILEDNIGEYLCYLGVGENFINKTQKHYRKNKVLYI